MPFSPPGACPNCDNFVPRGANRCRHCGSSSTDGWSDDADSTPVENPLTDFDYEDYLHREFEPRSPRPFSPRWILLALALLALTGLLLAPLLT